MIPFRRNKIIMKLSRGLRGTRVKTAMNHIPRLNWPCNNWAFFRFCRLVGRRKKAFPMTRKIGICPKRTKWKSRKSSEWIHDDDDVAVVVDDEDDGDNEGGWGRCCDVVVRLTWVGILWRDGNENSRDSDMQTENQAALIGSGGGGRSVRVGNVKRGKRWRN